MLSVVGLTTLTPSLLLSVAAIESLAPPSPQLSFRYLLATLSKGRITPDFEW